MGAGRYWWLSCKKNGINEAEFNMGGKRRTVSQTRAEIAFQLRNKLDLSAAEIARQLGVGPL